MVRAWLVGMLLAALTAAVALGAPGPAPTAKVKVGLQSGMLLPAAGSLWTTDLLGYVVRISPATNGVTRRIRFGSRPFGLAYGAGSVWVADRSVNTLGRINPRSSRVTARIKIGFDSYGVAFGAGSVWVTSEADGTVRRVNPKTNRVSAKIKVGTTPDGVVFSSGSIWVADLGRGSVVRINPATNRVTARIAVDKADWITPSVDALWVSSEAGFVARLDPSSLSVLAKVNVGANPLASAFVGGELWVPNLDGNTISIVDQTSSTVRTTISTGQGPLAVAEVAGDGWVSNSNEGKVWRLSPRPPVPLQAKAGRS
jgi:YVTN family beta-propeller protein